MKLSIEQVEEDPAERNEVEIVERKGLGHPDSICDGIAESVSRALCQEYRDRFGKVLHHNTDEAQLVAGSSSPENNETIEPIYLLLAGRATREFKGEKIPVDRIAVEAAREYIQDNFKQLEPEHFEIESRIGETSSDLETIFSERKRRSNDTSFGVGHAPLSRLEKVVRELEPEIRKSIDEAGEDIKVMGVRTGEELKLTVAAPAIAGRCDDYSEFVDQVHRIAVETGEQYFSSVSVQVNAADTEEEKYLTVTGTSAEMGDDGSVGRGNRVNGLITPNRSMSMEAASGKNPVTHVGKIYNLLAQRISQEIYAETGCYAHTKLVSEIGRPVDRPQRVSVETEASEEDVERIVEENLENADEITEQIIAGELETF